MSGTIPLLRVVDVGTRTYPSSMLRKLRPNGRGGSRQWAQLVERDSQAPVAGTTGGWRRPITKELGRPLRLLESGPRN